jgi:hypothetical protein
MKHTLQTLYAWIEKHAEPLAQYHIGDYCKQSGKIKKNNQYHYGYNSLKWLIYSLREQLSQDEIQNLFWNVLSERKSMNRSLHDLQHNIRSFRSVSPYQDLLTENQPDLSDVVKIKIEKYTFFLNPTNQNLTSILIGKENADMVFFVNPDNGDAGVVINTSCDLIGKTKMLADFYFKLGASEDGWTAVADKDDPKGRFNLFIRKGQEKPTVFSVAHLFSKLITTISPATNSFRIAAIMPEGQENVVFTEDRVSEAVTTAMDVSNDFWMELSIF